MSQSPINNYFDHIYCLNLDKRQDKWTSVQSTFEELGIVVERISAIDGETISEDLIKKYSNLKKGEIGCMLSHYKIIEDAKQKKYKRILVFEDDVIFAKNFNEKFSNQINKIKDWKILHLGSSQCNWKSIEFGDGFYYSKVTLGTFAIAFDESIYDEILSMCSVNAPIDAKLVNNQHRHYKECYTFYPNLAIADTVNSDIRKGNALSSYKDTVRWDLSLYDIKERFLESVLDTKPHEILIEENLTIEENVVIPSSKKNIIRKDKLRILLLPDTPNWAFDNIASAIIKYNPYPDKIEYYKKFIVNRPIINYDEWDFVYIFFEAEKLIPNNKEKTIRGCYSAYWLEKEQCTPEVIGQRFSECKAAIFVNDILEEAVSPFCKNIPNTTIFDSSDENIFYPIHNKKLEEFTVLFVGNTKRAIKNFESINYICEQAHVNLIVAQNIPNNELVNEYAKADVCINFSTSEGGPQTFIESALCGIPMIIKGNNALAQKIPCFTAMTKKGMIEKLVYLKNNRAECEKVGNEARKIALNKYTHEKTAKKFADFFLKLHNIDTQINKNTND